MDVEFAQKTQQLYKVVSNDTIRVKRELKGVMDSQEKRIKELQKRVKRMNEFIKQLRDNQTKETDICKDVDGMRLQELRLEDDLAFEAPRAGTEKKS